MYGTETRSRLSDYVGGNICINPSHVRVQSQVRNWVKGTRALPAHEESCPKHSTKSPRRAMRQEW